MKKFITFIILLVFTYLLCNHVVAADKPEYNINLISNELKENAKIVIRKCDLKVDVGTNSATLRYTKVISILNKNGTDYSVFHEMFDKFSSIGNLSIVIYDAEGRKVKSYGTSDSKDLPANDGFSLFSDNRIKYLDPGYKKFPCTFEITFKQKIESLLLLPNWYPIPDYNCSIEKSTFSITYSNDIKINFFEKNIQNQSQILNNEKESTRIWELQNIKSFSKEAFEESFIDFVPSVILSPLKFELDGTYGSFQDWNAFGNWYANLIKGRDELPEKTIKKIKDLVIGLDEKEKIEKIYAYMQQHTRYVSIQIGIGGWQPFDAKTVDRLGYGDCKALVNYMSTLLKSVGIYSFPVLIFAGENAQNLTIDFPSPSFNHVILAVPNNLDTLFLECTNQLIPCGYLGTFTDDRYGLLIKDNKGVLIKTKSIDKKRCVTRKEANVSVSENGQCMADLYLTSSESDYINDKYLSTLTNDEIKEKLYKNINIPNYVIKEFSIKQPDNKQPIINKYIQLELDQYAQKKGERLILPLNLISKKTEIPIITENRKSKILIKRYEIEFDSIIFNLPKDYHVEKIPQEVLLDMPFGYYKSSCSIIDGKLIYHRVFSLYPGVYDSSMANPIKDLFSKVCIADLEKVTLLKN